MTTPQTILLVDDHEIFRERLAKALRKRGYLVTTAGDVTQAIQAIASHSPDKAVIDLRMPGQSGLHLLAHLHEHSPTTKALILTGYGSIATTVDAMRLGACNFLAKPADADDILAAFERSVSPPLAPKDPSYIPPSLARTEWEHIQRVISDCGGNISKAARTLGIHRRSLQRKLKKDPPST